MDRWRASLATGEPFENEVRFRRAADGRYRWFVVRAVPQRETPRRPGDPPDLVADPSLARTRLGWQPRHSDLDTIIATALAWETRINRPRQVYIGSTARDYVPVEGR